MPRSLDVTERGEELGVLGLHRVRCDDEAAAWAGSRGQAREHGLLGGGGLDVVVRDSLLGSECLKGVPLACPEDQGHWGTAPLTNCTV